MGVQVLSHRRRRALSREYGTPIVWAHTGGMLTTIDHRHLRAIGTEAAVECATSCRLLFGLDEAGRLAHFMRGDCAKCDAGPGELHHRACEVLLWAIGSVAPDYWPMPVHRPAWVDQLGKQRAELVDAALITGGASLAEQHF